MANYDASGDLTCRASSGATTSSQSGAQLTYDNGKPDGVAPCYPRLSPAAATPCQQVSYTEWRAWRARRLTRGVPRARRAAESEWRMIRASNLTRRFGDFTAVNRIALDVPDGAILALLGPNGAGKTTTVRMLAGLIAPSEGEATVAGYDIRRQASAVRARVGLVTDVPGLYEQMTMPAYLDFFGAVYGVPRDLRAWRIAELAAFFDLTDHQNERMAGFSKGMKQKVALARALLHEPLALFLDEPTSGLDPLAARAVRDLIVGLKRANRSIILCTHDLGEAERLADQIAIISAGAIVRHDTPSALRAGSSAQIIVRVRLAAPLDGLDAAVAANALAGLVGVTPLAAPNQPANVLTYRTDDPDGANPAAIARLVAAGARIVAVTCEARALEDVYAEAVGARETDRATLAGIVE